MCTYVCIHICTHNYYTHYTRTSRTKMWFWFNYKSLFTVKYMKVMWKLSLFFVLSVFSSFLVLVLYSHPSNIRKYLASQFRIKFIVAGNCTSIVLDFSLPICYYINLWMYKTSVSWNSMPMYDLQKICWLIFYKTSLLEHEKVFFVALLFVLSMMLWLLVEKRTNPHFGMLSLEKPVSISQYSQAMTILTT